MTEALDDKPRKERQYLFLSTKLFILFAILFVVISAAFLVYALSTDRMLAILQNSQTQHYRIARLQTLLRDVEADLAHYTEHRDVYSLNAYGRKKEQTWTEYTLLEPRVTNQEEVAVHQDIGMSLSTYFAHAEETIRLLRAKEAAYGAAYGEAEQEMRETNVHLSDYLSILLKEDEAQYSVLKARNTQMRIVNLTALLVALGLAFFFAVSISGQLAVPLRRLAVASREMAAHDLRGGPLPVEQEDEVGVVTRAFNEMRESIQEHIIDLEESRKTEAKLHERELANIRMKELLRESQLLALQSQINPHFLFNTLNTISRSVKRHDPAVTQQLIASLASLFRYNIDHFGTLSTLGNEIDIVEKYIYIQQYRFSDRMEFHVTGNRECYDAAIPSMILQPLVENAIIHGLEGLARGGRIVIHTARVRDAVRICVYDNGVGMSEEVRRSVERISRTAQTGHTTGIGLSNIIDRVALIEGASVELPRVKRGTLVRIVMPYGKG